MKRHSVVRQKLISHATSLNLVDMALNKISQHRKQPRRNLEMSSCRNTIESWMSGLGKVKMEHFFSNQIKLDAKFLSLQHKLCLYYNPVHI